MRDLNRRRPAHVVAIGLIAILVVVACSTGIEPGATPLGGGPTPTVQATAPTSATATAAATPTPVPTATPTPGPTPFVAGTMDAPRVIVVAMLDRFAFEPAAITVQAGETVRFVLDNRGVLPHDFTVGDRKAQMHHAEDMARGGHGHDGAPNAVMVEGGMTGDLVVTFPDAPVDWLIGCHVPGHYAAGMHGTMHVVAAIS